MNAILQSVSHRPWPVPVRLWLMKQVWHDLLFAHWPVEHALLRPLVPRTLELEIHEGYAWIGVVPFRMSGIRFRGVPPLPSLSAFPELNVRTYVTYGGRPGVWFFSLDAARLLAVRAARRMYHLPYYHARMECRSAGCEIHYSSVRRGPAFRAQLKARYQPEGEMFEAVPRTLEHWLTERYCLYAMDDRGTIYRGEIHHAPWKLQRATAAIEENTMIRPIGLDLPESAPLLHFARRQEVLVWSLDRV